MKNRFSLPSNQLTTYFLIAIVGFVMSISYIQATTFALDECEYPQPILSRGSRGIVVFCLQRALNELVENDDNRFSGPYLEEDGIFGPITESAVINFKRSRGLTPNGRVDDITWSWLLHSNNGQLIKCEQTGYPRVAYYSPRRDAVRCAQILLNSHLPAPGIAIDGIFGPKTLEATRNFQGSNGLERDGIIWRCTWAALKDEIIPPDCARLTLSG